MRLTGVAVVLLVGWASAFAEDIDEQALKRHRALETRLKREEATNAQLLDEAVVLEKGAEAFRTAADLMTGKRTDLPPVVRAAREIAVYESDEAAVFACDAASGKSALRMYGLDLEGGVTYRFTATVGAEAAAPAKRIKFGLRVVKADGKVDWPSAAIGRGDGPATFAPSTASFEYRLPHGARAVLVYGLSAPATGSVSFRDVRVERMR